MSVLHAELIICASLLVTLGAYIVFSRHEGSYVNIMVCFLVAGVPAIYLLPLVYLQFFGVEGSSYAYAYVYASLAVENVCFVGGYIWTRSRVFRLSSFAAYANFHSTAVLLLGLSFLIYMPVLIEFRDSILNPRAIYEQTRTGYGFQFFVSSVLAFIAIIFTLFSQKTTRTKVGSILVASGLILLHGSKGQILSVLLLVALYLVYVKAKKFRLLHTAIFGTALSLILVLLFVATMSLGGGLDEMVETMSQYADYTRNAIAVVDSQYPTQYGRITFEANVYGLVPRILMPSKPKAFGPFRLADYFTPEAFDTDSGAPAFGVGIQYADFGSLAIVYIALISFFRGSLARFFVNRLRLTQHPADFFMVAFLADVPLFPTGVGWLLPEALIVAFGIRYLSCIGANRLYRERSGARRRVTLGASIDPHVEPIS